MVVWDFLSMHPALIAFLVFCGITIWGFTEYKRKPSLKVTVQDVRIGTLKFDKGQDIIQFFIHLTLKAPRDIHLRELDLVVEDQTSKRTFKPAERLSTTLVKGVVSYEVEYRVPNGNRLLIQHGMAKEKWFPESDMRVKTYLRVIAGKLDFNTEPFLLVSRKEGSQKTSYKGIK